jgi:hypothetical protein
MRYPGGKGGSGVAQLIINQQPMRTIARLTIHRHPEWFNPANYPARPKLRAKTPHKPHRHMKNRPERAADIDKMLLFASRGRR